MTCSHDDYVMNGTMTRHRATVDGAEVVGYTTTIVVSCRTCGMKFIDADTGQEKIYVDLVEKFRPRIFT